MSKRRMVGWRPLAVENQDAPSVAPPPAEPETSVEPASSAAPAAAVDQSPAPPEPVQPAQPAAEPAPAASTGPVQDTSVQRRRMAGWQPLSVANTAAPGTSAPIASTAEAQAATAPDASVETPQQAAPASSGPVQAPNVPRRRMAGWQPLMVAHDAPTVRPATSATPAAPVPPEEPAPAAETAEAALVATSATAAPTASAPEADGLPRRRMEGWQPLQVGHPDPIAAVAAEPAETQAEPAAEPTPAEAPIPAPKKTRMGAPAASAPAETPAAEPAPEPEVKMPDVVTPPPAKQPTATETVEKDIVKEPSKLRKALVLVGIVAVVAVVGVLLAQWLRTLDPVANFIDTYDGTPTHPDAVDEGIPGWVGWQHFFNFFIMVMVIRSGFIIRNQERPEAYWTPNQGGFFSPKRNSPQKVSIQQWIHQSFNVLWVLNGLIFYVMVFATGHWMRLVPTNWDIFPNIVSAGLQYVSLDWPAENSWVYYNALQIMTYFITVFIAAPIAILSGLRLSTWWPQQAKGLNKAFPLEAARKVHFITMLYFVLFIIVHLFLVLTTGVLSNLNMMFTARQADDWIGIGVFALSVAVTVGIAWLIKPIFISPIAEKTGQVSTR